MRKLSKKISMLMVLAMLVSLFSGVVSASAASVWSFYNKTAGEIVEVKETIEMEKGEFADFDLYKEGKAVTKDTYTVVYASSDEDVVWVDAKNGKLRADKFEKAEAGDKATISATFTNVATGKSATRSFVIEIAADEEVEYAITTKAGDVVLGAEAIVADKEYALTSVVTANGEEVEATVVYTVNNETVTALKLAAGEYVVEAVATIDGEEVAAADYDVVAVAEVPEIVEAKQTSLTTAEITFNNADWAKSFVNKVKLSYMAGEVEIADLVKKAEAKDATVTVTLYNAMAADVTYKFAYDGYDCVATIKGAKSVPASIKVVGGNVAAQTEGQLDIKIYTADGVDITTNELKLNVSYAGTDDSVSVVAGDKIYFFEAGKTAVVNATYEMGYDDNGYEIADLKATGVYYSVPAFTDSNLNGYAADANNIENSNLSYGNNITLSLSDTKFLHAKYTRTAANGNATQIYVVAGADSVAKTTYTYYSTNESVLLVDQFTGQLTPCSEGVASVYLKDANNTVVGSVAINVKGARALTTLTASLTDRMVSAGDLYTDNTTVSVSTKDQLGDYIDAAWNVEIVNPAGNLADYLAWETVMNNGQVTGIKLTPNNANIEAGKTKVVTFKITATVGNVNKTWNGSVSIKNINGVNASSTVLDLSAASVDMKLNKTKADDYNVFAKLVMKDNAGYDLGLKDYTYITAEADAVTANGAYSIIVKKNNDTNGQAATGIIVDEGNTIKFTPVTGTDVVTKTGKDTYTIKVFKGNGTKAQLYATKTVSFTDSTNAITVVVNKNNIDGTNAADVKASLDFYRDGVKITDKVTDAVIKDSTILVNEKKVYVKTITVTVLNKEMNNNFGGAHTEDVAVNQLYIAP